MHPGALLDAALDALAVMGTPAVSVFAGDAATISVEDLVDMGPIPHASICTRRWDGCVQRALSFAERGGTLIAAWSSGHDR